jgi:hypothetical protein
VSLANQLCVGLCGADASGDCSFPHPNPGCDRRECCETVCAIDPYCCDFSWDFTCVVLAGIQCEPKNPVPCGDPAAGSCTEPHSTPACDDESCCDLVCGLDPTCCTGSWDFLCVALAKQYCVKSCEPPCPAGSTSESEDCGQDRNNPCYGTPSVDLEIQSLACGAWGCGQIASVPGGFRDVDAWSVSVVDADGDGLVPVRLSMASSFDGFAALVPVSCGPLSEALVSISSDYCVEFASAVSCVPPGEYRVVVAAGAFPNPGNPELTCGIFGTTRYRVRLECLANGCGPACGPGAGSCFEPRKLPGCEDTECCDAVCSSDPACCEEQWDTACVQAAQVACADPPPNDECSGAIELGGGSVEVVTIGATAGGPAFPVSCGGTDAGADVWFRVVAPRTATCTVTTCGSGTIDTVVAVYENCGGQSLVCNDNASACIPETSSRVSFAAACGSEYLIRVAAIGGMPGTATLRVDFGPGKPCACPADLTGDRVVNGADLTILLGGWGAAGPGDLDGDGTVGASDLTVILSAWGACP